MKRQRSMKNFRFQKPLYVPMCAAMVHARVARLVFGARDLRFGGVRSKFRLADSELLNHRVELVEGVCAAGHFAERTVRTEPSRISSVARRTTGSPTASAWLSTSTESP